jgi:hypothetical protein
MSAAFRPLVSVNAWGALHRKCFNGPDGGSFGRAQWAPRSVGAWVSVNLGKRARITSVIMAGSSLPGRAQPAHVRRCSLRRSSLAAPLPPAAFAALLRPRK